MIFAPSNQIPLLNLYKIIYFCSLSYEISAILRNEDINEKIKEAIIMLNNRVQAAKKAEELHRQNLQKSVEHRLQVAKANGDENLVRQLEAEMKYLA